MLIKIVKVNPQHQREFTSSVTLVSVGFPDLLDHEIYQLRIKLLIFVYFIVGSNLL